MLLNILHGATKVKGRCFVMILSVIMDILVGLMYSMEKED